MSLCTLTDERDARGDFVTTYSGAKFFLADCNVEDIPMFDIAHALSMNCRFNGHLKRFYSVAEHSVNVALLVGGEHALTALLHDVSEAFLPDMPRPFKRYVTGFEKFETRVYSAFAELYNLKDPMPEDVLYIDRNIVRTEAEVLYPSPPDWVEYYDTVCPASMIQGLPPVDARTMFMETFVELMYENDKRIAEGS